MNITRPAPANCQHEPPYPSHETVVCSLAAPDLTAHLPAERCATETTHAIAECGEFRETRIVPMACPGGCGWTLECEVVGKVVTAPPCPAECRLSEMDVVGLHFRALEAVR